MPGGYLFVETVAGHGGNHVELPRVGEIAKAVARSFEIEVYRERRVGPPELNAAAVVLLARRK